MALDTNLPYPSDKAPDTLDEPASLWKLYSLGLAANNKTTDSNLLYVTPIESFYMQDGELVSNPFHQEAEGWDGKDELYKTKVVTDTAVEAIWKGDTNRRTSPDVRRGERVWLYRYADQDKFYWVSAGMDDHLRKLETVVFGISGTPVESEDGTLVDHGYHVEMSTHKGSITLQTSAKNGEYTTYAFQIDAKGGRITISDALGNNIHLNSVETLIELENADKTIVQLTKQDIKMYAPQNIEMKADQNITMKAGNAVSVEAGGNIVLKSGGKVLVDGQSQFMGPVKMDAPLEATGITSTEPIEGPTDTI